MGYYTRFRLQWERWEGDAEPDDIIRFLKKEYERFYGIDENGETLEPVKWYDHESDMLALSLKFPGYLFTLSGEGEESGDIWKDYYLSGQRQHTKVKLVFDEPDPNILAPGIKVHFQIKPKKQKK